MYKVGGIVGNYTLLKIYGRRKNENGTHSNRLFDAVCNDCGKHFEAMQMSNLLRDNKCGSVKRIVYYNHQVSPHITKFAKFAKSKGYNTVADFVQATKEHVDADYLMKNLKIKRPYANRLYYKHIKQYDRQRFDDFYTPCHTIIQSTKIAIRSPKCISCSHEFEDKYRVCLDHAAMKNWGGWKIADEVVKTSIDNE